jgi:hypothetical protein
MCNKLRHIYHGDEEWVICYPQVIKKFAILKEKAKVFYPEKNVEGVLSELVRWPDEDIRDLLFVSELKASKFNDLDDINRVP